MPYGLSPEQKKKGGDTFMEGCVAKVMRSDTLKDIKDPKEKKSRAVAICKSALNKKNSELIVDTVLESLRATAEKHDMMDKNSPEMKRCHKTMMDRNPGMSLEEAHKRCMENLRK